MDLTDRQPTFDNFPSLTEAVAEVIARHDGDAWIRVVAEKPHWHGAIWLLMHYLVNTPDGKRGPVNDGKPILDADMARELECPLERVMDWREALAAQSLISQEQVGEGYVIKVL